MEKAHFLNTSQAGSRPHVGLGPSMINTSYSSHQILSLFGRQDAAASAPNGAPAQAAAKAVAKLAEQVRTADAKVAQAGTGPGGAGPGVGAGLPVVVPLNSDGTPKLSYEEIVRRNAAAEARMAEYEAREAAFEAENGFRRRVNETVLNSQAATQSGQIYAMPQASFEDAAHFAERILISVAHEFASENRSARALADPAQLQATAESEGLTAEQASAFLQDRREAGHIMGMFEAAVLAKTFQVTGGSGSVVEQHEGTWRLANVELRYEGRLVLTVEGNGDAVTRYDQAGQVVSIIGVHASEAGRPEAMAQAATPEDEIG
jgi:hypothetical protein